MNFNIKPWNCPQCTFHNNKSYYKCNICELELEKYSLDIPQNIINKSNNYKSENKMDKFIKVFGKNNVLLPVIHCLEINQVMRNCEICFNNNVDGIWLIGHYLDHKILLDILAQIRKIYHNKWIGLNFLDLHPFQVFMFLNNINVKIDGIWCDNGGVCDDDKIAEINLYHMMSSNLPNLLYFGGIAFKHQKQPNNLIKTLNMASQYMDIMVSSGIDTGIAMDINKSKCIIYNCDNTPIGVASGVNYDNLSQFIKFNCIIISKGIELDFYNIDESKLIKFIKNLKNITY